MDTEKLYYVYAHYVPGSDEPFNIGKGRGNRHRIIGNRNESWKSIVDQFGFESKILHDNLDEETAFDVEANYIACYGRADMNEGCLVNRTDGYERFAARHSEESIRKMSASQKAKLATPGYINPRVGKKRSAAARKRMSDAHKKRYASGAISPTKGKSKSIEMRLRISESLKKRYANGYVAPQKGKKHSAETRAKMSIIAKERIKLNG